MRNVLLVLLLSVLVFGAEGQKAEKFFDKAEAEFNKGNNVKAKELLKSSLAEIPAERTLANDLLAERAFTLLMEIDSYALINVEGPKFIRKLEAYYGTEDTISADYLGFFGGVAFGLGEYNQASELFNKALLQFEVKGVTTSINYGVIASNLGLMKVLSGEFKDAFEPLEKSLKVFERSPEVFGIELAMVHSNLGQAHQSAYNQYEALTHYEKSIFLFEEARFIESDYYNTLSNLSTLYIDYNQYEVALEISEKVLKRTAKIDGVDSEAYAISCNNMAVIKNALGDFASAEEYYQKAADIKRKKYSRSHPSYILSLANQGKFFSDMGRHAKGLEMVEEAIGLCQDNPDVTTQVLEYLNVKASILLKEKRNLEALRTHEDLMIQAKKVYGINSEPTNMYLINYAVVLKEAGRVARANEISDSLAGVLEQLNLFEADHFNFLYNRSVLLYERGLLDESKALILPLLNEYQEKYSEYHPLFLEAKMHYGSILHSNGEHSLGFENELSACEVLLDNAEQIFGTLTEIEKSQFLENQQRLIKKVYAHFYGVKNVSNEHVSRLTNISLRVKSLVLNHSIITLRNIERSNGSLKGKLQLLKNERSRYAKAIYLSKNDREKIGVNPGQLLAQIRFLEKELVQLSGVRISSSAVDWKTVQKKLSPREAAVIVLHSPADDKIKAISTYEAIVIRRDEPQPLFVSIGEDNKLDNLYYVSFMKAIGYKVQEGHSFNRYWKRIDSFLSGIDKVYYTGEGIYHKLSISALFDKAQGVYLGDRLDIVHLASFSNAEVFKDSRLPKKARIDLFGNPDFYHGAEKGVHTFTIDHHVTRSKVEIREEWGELPGAEQEVKNIKEMCDANGLQSNLFLNARASEERVKAVNSPTVLHIATHGFFEYDEDSVRSANSVHSFVHPMMSSALLLKEGGISYGLRKRHSLANKEDGILCAFEVQNMSLAKNKLVVMSACESGLGSVRDAEGVFGLQRGFLLAGSEHIMMSLWKVNDLATQDFVTAFYSKYLTGIDIHESFRFAQVETRKKYPEPVYWAAFVLISN